MNKPWVQLLVLLLLLLAVFGCTPAAEVVPVTGAEIPAEWVERNWGAEGSCCHAAIVTLLRWQNRPQTADRYRATHSGGSHDEHLPRMLDAAGIRYADTYGTCNVAFLQWAVDTRRGCGVMLKDFYGPRRDARHYWHMVVLVSLDEMQAGLIDPNYPRSVVYLDSQEFCEWWCSSNSWAITPVYQPVPPQPLY